MPRPGVTTTVVEDLSGGGAVSTGTAFMVGVAEKGPAAVPTRVTSFRQYKERFGSLAGGPDLYKAAYAFFNEGGLFLYVVRATGAGAVAANGTAAGWFRADATSPGVWGNNIRVEADPQAGSNPTKYVVSVYDNNVLKERSVPLTGADVTAYKSDLVALSQLGTTYPADTAATVSVSLTTGANGSAPTDAEIIAALNSIGYAYGPGQVAIPNSRVAAQWTALADHCWTNQRVGLIDLADTADVSALKTAVDTLQGSSAKGSRLILCLGDVIQYPGETPPVIWEVPYSGIQMGMVGRVDGLGDPSLVAAGSLGTSRLATGIKRNRTDAEREDANYNGVTFAKVINGQVRTYGQRVATGLDDTNWVFWQEARVAMNVAHECDSVLEEFVFQTIDGRGKIFARVNAALVGVCQRYWQSNALYGDTAGEAFAVDTSFPGINTPATVAAGEIHAQVRLKTSRVGEWVALDIVKVPLERTI